MAGELAEMLLIDSTRWTRLRPTQMKSDKGASFSVLPDGSILVGGAAVMGDRYRVEFTLEKEIELAGVRLEALTHDSLPGRGPGRYPGRDPANSYRGTFAQMSWVATATLPNRKDPITLDFDNGVTNLFPISSKGAWTIAGGGEGRDCSAVSPLASPVTLPAGTSLAFEMHFGGLGPENLGRFRLSLSPDRAGLERQERLPRRNSPTRGLTSLPLRAGRSDRQGSRILRHSILTRGRPRRSRRGHRSGRTVPRATEKPIATMPNTGGSRPCWRSTTPNGRYRASACRAHEGPRAARGATGEGTRERGRGR